MSEKTKKCPSNYLVNNLTVRCQSQDPRRGSDFVSTNATSQMTPEVKPPLKEGVLTSAFDGTL